MLALFGLYYGAIFVIYKSTDDRKLPSMSFSQKHRKTLSEIDLFPTKWLRHDKPWINSGDQLQIVENGFILDFDQLKILQTTNLDYKSRVILF